MLGGRSAGLFVVFAVARREPAPTKNRILRRKVAKVRQGVEVVVEQDNRPVAVIKTPPVIGRKISEVIAAMKASGANAVIDEDFARDVEEAIRLHSQPWNPQSWD